MSDKDKLRLAALHEALENTPAQISAVMFALAVAGKAYDLAWEARQPEVERLLETLVKFADERNWLCIICDDPTTSYSKHKCAFVWQGNPDVAKQAKAALDTEVKEKE